MDLNRETAMRLWNKHFGKATTVTDFAGRTIVKGAYNDRNSEFGWNVDHVLPQCRGGTTADHNLICCHIKTNDEKANKFPCFSANGMSFEIIKVQNHYEIRPKKEVQNLPNSQETTDVNFYDSAAGVRYFKKLKGTQNQKKFVGTIFIKLYGLTNSAVVDFIEELIDFDCISYKCESHGYGNELIVVLQKLNLPLKSDMEAMLDQCVLLNTYLSAYFLPCEHVKSFGIYFRIDCFDDRNDMYRRIGSIKYPNNYSLLFSEFSRSSMFVNELVLLNTEAGKKVEQRTFRTVREEYTEYNYIFTKLSENLKKEAGGR